MRLGYIFIVYAVLISVEFVSMLHQRELTRTVFIAAQEEARRSQRKLVVIGDPGASLKNMFTRDYSCGDICIDLHGCTDCSSTTQVIKSDIIDALQTIGDDSVVIFESCVLAYVHNRKKAEKEMLRAAGSSSRVYSVDLLSTRLYTRAVATFQHYRYEEQWIHFLSISFIFHLVLLLPLLCAIRTTRFNLSQSPRVVCTGVLPAQPV